MNQIHVCLVSDKTIPNILAIHHFKPDEVLFITAQKMEEKGKVPATVDTLRRLDLSFSEDRLHKVVVQEESTGCFF